MFIWQSAKMSLMGAGLGSFYIYWRLHEQARHQRTQLKTEFLMQRDLLYQLKLREISKSPAFRQVAIQQ